LVTGGVEQARPPVTARCRYAVLGHHFVKFVWRRDLSRIGPFHHDNRTLVNQWPAKVNVVKKHMRSLFEASISNAIGDLDSGAVEAHLDTAGEF
jgi:hypothetical protein